MRKPTCTLLYLVKVEQGSVKEQLGQYETGCKTALSRLWT